MEINWSEFKNIVDVKNISIQYVTVGNNYLLKAIDGGYENTCLIPTDPEHADTIDFETNYKLNGNRHTTNLVTTQLELNDKVLKLASSIADFTGDEAVLEICVPGTFTGVDHQTCDGRYIAGGYGWTNDYEFGDRISKVEVVDKDNIFGYGAGVIVKCYHDENLDEFNMGWRLWASLNGEGEVEIDPIGGYGFIPSGLYIRITFLKNPTSNASKAAVNIWWGRRE